MDVELFKRRLVQALTESGRARKDIAANCGFAPGAFCNWLSGRNAPSALLLATFCAEINISLDWLCGLTDVKDLRR